MEEKGNRGICKPATWESAPIKQVQQGLLKMKDTSRGIHHNYNLRLTREVPCRRTPRIQAQIDGKAVTYALNLLTDNALTFRQSQGNYLTDTWKLKIFLHSNLRKLTTNSLGQPFINRLKLGHVVQVLVNLNFCCNVMSLTRRDAILQRLHCPGNNTKLPIDRRSINHKLAYTVSQSATSAVAQSVPVVNQLHLECSL